MKRKRMTQLVPFLLAWLFLGPSLLGFSLFYLLPFVTGFYYSLVIYLWKNIGYSVILFLAGLQNIPAEYYEAARIDGASQPQEFFRISMVYGFKDLDIDHFRTYRK